VDAAPPRSTLNLLTWWPHSNPSPQHHLITPVIERMESQSSCYLKCELTALIHHKMPAYTGFSLVLLGLIKYLKSPWTVWEFAVDRWFHSGYQGIIWIRWIFFWFSGSSVLVFRFLWVRFTFSACNRFTRFKLVPDIILWMTLFNVTATPGIVTTKIGLRAEVHTAYLWGGVVCSSKWQRGTEFSLCNRFHSHSSRIIPG